MRLKILKGKPGAGLHKNNLENNQNTGESNLEIHANEVEIGEKNNKKTEMAAGTKITSAVHANNTRKIGKILKISLRKGKNSSNKKVPTLKVSFSCHISLVTQPMLQHRPNPTELRSMDSYIRILCRFQKCKRKVPPPSLLSNEKSPFTPQRGLTFLEST